MATTHVAELPEARFSALADSKDERIQKRPFWSRQHHFQQQRLARVLQ